MKMKYTLEKSEKNQFIIKELSALDKKDVGMFSLLCESIYDTKDIEAALSEGKEALADVIRTPNFYPQSTHVDELADAIATMFGKEDKSFAEISVDDYDLLAHAVKLKDEEKLLAEIEEGIEEDTLGIDELLDDDDDGIKNIKTTIRVADEEAIDIDKDTKIEDIVG